MKRPLLMGIVNVTPDSFSGDGQLGEAAVAAARRLVEAGVDILDLGAESTRPNGVALAPDEEWQRLAPVLAALAGQAWHGRVHLSVDTRHAGTAARALNAGVDIINDVSGLADPELREVLAAQRCDVVVMHALSVPVDPALTLPPDCDVVAEILAWKAAVTQTAQEAGIAAERLVYDPGLGFGKTARQSLELILSAERLVASGGRWLVGHSRKSFLKLFTSEPPARRDELTLAFSAALAHAGVQLLRVHEVARHKALLDELSR
ncbi:Dihydropteroate synthase [Rubrivivax sp. A210]|uniref:dihydropteroate synthase n=1 Tax=Rubrivivax sp. A210 TaxID=2772301 RepID=UPI0019189E81|nr:dihydropteroate synthase [Rubrivivax sp. A210]CAD5372176.1 Dihydropteroate synthase [Rubrivivax sp. A210]